MNLDTADVIIVAQAALPSTPAEVEAAHEAHEAADASQEGQLHAGTEAHPGGHSEVFPPFDPASFTSQLIWLAITFAILYVVLSRVALPRIGGIIEDRKTRIDADLANAEASREKTDAAIASYEAALAEARRKAQAMAEQSRASIQSDIAARRAGVEAELAQRVTEAERRIQATKSEALGHVEDIAAETVAAVVAHLTGPVNQDEARAAVAVAAREQV